MWSGVNSCFSHGSFLGPEQGATRSFFAEQSVSVECMCHTKILFSSDFSQERDREYIEIREGGRSTSDFQTKWWQLMLLFIGLRQIFSSSINSVWAHSWFDECLIHLSGYTYTCTALFLSPPASVSDYSFLQCMCPSPTLYTITTEKTPYNKYS